MRQFKLPRPLALSAFALVAAFMAGCSETNPPTGLPSLLVSDNPDVHACENEDVELSKFKLIKVGGTGTFQVVVTLESNGNLLEDFTVTLDDGECAVVHENDTNLAAQATRVTVTETSGDFVSVDLTLIDSRNGITEFTGLTDPTVTALVSAQKSGKARYFNEPGDEDNGFAACTPGFWRQPHHFWAWEPTGLSPSDIFNTVFGVNYFSASFTLEDAIWQGGGGLGKVARHGTAGLLNALHPDVDYPWSAAQVIAAVQAGNVDAIADTNDELDCSIDGNGNGLSTTSLRAPGAGR